MWFLWAVLAAALLALSAWGFARHFPVYAARSHKGTFESHIESIDLEVPAGLPLKSVLIREGDRVEAGDILARFDQVTLHQRTFALRNAVKEAQALQACWREPPATAVLLTHDAQSTALARCRNRHRQDHLAREHLQYRRNGLRRETALAVQELISRAQNAPTSAQNILMLRAALERETLQSHIRAVEFDLALLIQQQEAARLREVARLETEIARLTSQLAALEDIARAPWLAAPRDGRIEHVRSLSHSSSGELPLTLAKIRIDSGQSYTARFVLPAAEAAALSPGDQLSVSLAGLPRFQTPVTGRIDELRPATPAHGRAETEVFLRFAPFSNQTAITDQIPAGAQSTLSVELPVQSLAEILQGSAERLLTSF